MRYELFIDEVVKEVGKFFDGREFSVNVNHVYKNNGIKLDGLVILREGSKLSPNIYLNSFYDKYQEGESIDSVVNKIIEIYYDSQNSDIVGKFDLDYAYDKVKDKIVYKLVNFDKNREMLKDVPFKKFLNLAIVCQCVINTNMEGIASIRVTHNHCESWGIDSEELFKVAMSNTPKLFPAVIRNMKEVIADLMFQNHMNMFDEVFDGIDIVQEDNDCYYYNGSGVYEDAIQKMIDKVTEDNIYDMYVLSNSYGVNGATAMVYNGVLEKFANRLRKDLYILPSSVHEVIILPKVDDISAQRLKEMVCEINRTSVPEEEILSDNVYVYSMAKRAIKVVKVSELENC